MGLFKDKMKDPVQGSAEVIDRSGFIQGSGRPRMRLIVTADGVPPTPVSFRGQLSDKKARVPDIGDSIPVTVDRANPQNISIKWSDLPTQKARNRQQADQREQERLAEARGEGPLTETEREGQEDIEDARQMWREMRERGEVTEEQFEKEMRSLDEA